MATTAKPPSLKVLLTCSSSSSSSLPLAPQLTQEFPLGPSPCSQAAPAYAVPCMGTGLGGEGSNGRTTLAGLVGII